MNNQPGQMVHLAQHQLHNHYYVQRKVSAVEEDKEHQNNSRDSNRQSRNQCKRCMKCKVNVMVMEKVKGSILCNRQRKDWD